MTEELRVEVEAGKDTEKERLGTVERKERDEKRGSQKWCHR